MTYAGYPKRVDIIYMTKRPECSTAQTDRPAFEDITEVGPDSLRPELVVKAVLRTASFVPAASAEWVVAELARDILSALARSGHFPDYKRPKEGR